MKEEALSVINEHISEEELSIEELGKESGMSRAHVFKKIKALTGKSPKFVFKVCKVNKSKKRTGVKDNRETYLK
ncbi:MAG: hypothetical protein MZV64_31300 [Ignavibacteriales bacterium]|nr:hypothetical protein [Ignavibacteriales bacterium]